MNNQPDADTGCFRFRAGTGRWLSDEIARIEALATERRRAGIPSASVTTGALALLRLALDDVVGAWMADMAGASDVSACARMADAPRCGATEGMTR